MTNIQICWLTVASTKRYEMPAVTGVTGISPLAANPGLHEYSTVMQISRDFIGHHIAGFYGRLYDRRAARGSRLRDDRNSRGSSGCSATICIDSARYKILSQFQRVVAGLRDAPRLLRLREVYASPASGRGKFNLVPWTCSRRTDVRINVPERGSFSIKVSSQRNGTSERFGPLKC